MYLTVQLSEIMGDLIKQIRPKKTHYLIGKLPDQTVTEVQIRTRIRPDSKTYHDEHITFVYTWQMTALLFMTKRHQ